MVGQNDRYVYCILSREGEVTGVEVGCGEVRVGDDAADQAAIGRGVVK